MRQLLITIAAILIIGCGPSESDLALEKRVVGKYILTGQTYIFDKDGTVKIYEDDGTFVRKDLWYVKNGKIYKDFKGARKGRLTTWRMLDNGNLQRHLPKSGVSSDGVWLTAKRIEAEDN